MERHTGEPCAVKVARTVRRGAVGKVPKGNSLAAYPTLEGSKTVESRFSRHRIAPYGAVHSGDVVLLKRSAAKTVTGICIVRKVWFYQLNSDKLELIRNYFATALRADDYSFWEKHKSARFATLMRIAEVYPLPPIQVPKRDRRGWVVLRSRQQKFLYDGGS